MTFRLMRIFRSVAEHKSFSRAAAEMEITRPAVSQAVTQLEEQLQVKLFNRTTRRVNLTSQGILYYHNVVDILERLDSIEEQLRTPDSGPSGRIRIEVSPVIAKAILLPHLVEFHKQYPNIEIFLGTNDTMLDFEETSIDFAVHIGEINNPNVEVKQIGDINFICCAAPSYIEKYGTPESLDELKAHRAVNYFSQKTGRVLPWPFIVEDDIVFASLKHDIAVDDADTCLSYTLAGKGVSVLPHFLAKKHIEEGSLVRLLDEHEIDDQPLNLIYLPNKIDNQKLGLFSDWLQEVTHDQIFH